MNNKFGIPVPNELSDPGSAVPTKQISDPGFTSQEDNELADVLKLIAAEDFPNKGVIRSNTQVTDTLNALRDTCGYIENGGGTKVSIYQDDATRTWTVTVGTNSYWDESFEGAIHKAHAAHHELIEPRK